MKLKPILAAFAVAVAALAQPALANFQFTQNEKGEVTHYNGIPLPPVQTVEEAKAQAQKEIAAAKKAREAQQVEQPDTRHSSPATPSQEVFFTGKPYLKETGQYLFLFRHYDPELARWSIADPSGFPDGANNVAYMAVPTSQFDWQGLKSVAVLYGWFDSSNQHQCVFPDGSGYWTDSDFDSYSRAAVDSWIQRLNELDARPGSTHNYLNDGDYITPGSLTDWSQLSAWSSYDRIYLSVHGATSGPEIYFVNGVGRERATLPGNVYQVLGCNPVQGAIPFDYMGGMFFSVAEFVRDAIE